MFSRAAFLPVEGPLTFHDLSRETGKVWEEQVTKDLSHLVFDELFPRLVTAIAAHDKKRPADIGRDYLDQVRQSALVLLYRLLFVVYAEDRDLLPDNRQPYKDFSLTTMRLEIAKRKADGKAESSTHASFWPRLTAIFKAISEGDNDFGIPPYNGGLFAKETAPLLAEVLLPDAIITDLVYGLSHRIEDGEPRYINYRDLSVQQLGSVYERTLELCTTIEVVMADALFIRFSDILQKRKSFVRAPFLAIMSGSERKTEPEESQQRAATGLGQYHRLFVIILWGKIKPTRLIEAVCSTFLDDVSRNFYGPKALMRF